MQDSGNASKTWLAKHRLAVIAIVVFITAAGVATVAVYRQRAAVEAFPILAQWSQSNGGAQTGTQDASEGPRNAAPAEESSGEDALAQSRTDDHFSNTNIGNGMILPLGIALNEFKVLHPEGNCFKYSDQVGCEFETPTPKLCVAGATECQDAVYWFQKGVLTGFSASYNVDDWRRLLEASTAKYGNAQSREAPNNIQPYVVHEWTVQSHSLSFVHYTGADAWGRPLREPYVIHFGLGSMIGLPNQRELPNSASETDESARPDTINPDERCEPASSNADSRTRDDADDDGTEQTFGLAREERHDLQSPGYGTYRYECKGLILGVTIGPTGTSGALVVVNDTDAPVKIDPLHITIHAMNGNFSPTGLADVSIFGLHAGAPIGSLDGAVEINPGKRAGYQLSIFCRQQGETCAGAPQSLAANDYHRPVVVSVRVEGHLLHWTSAE